ncbi:hypothetical protein E8L99_16500 [Phreatobacter aquaticus]|uniref:Uncharacterized protein n=1 Tax=Phreatobacter aquaticus TaxID=2570229 RepID=A0A4D7QT76_9HYPH|nr:hypothetical protein [Phreatobacter aquaticus]QCK87242.1 hypothetical protein E8L99_16500 [Phreatobacter aquaticus]
MNYSGDPALTAVALLKQSIGSPDPREALSAINRAAMTIPVTHGGILAKLETFRDILETRLHLPGAAPAARALLAIEENAGSATPEMREALSLSLPALIKADPHEVAALAVSVSIALERLARL